MNDNYTYVDEEEMLDFIKAHLASVGMILPEEMIVAVLNAETGFLVSKGLASYDEEE